ncbi:hypothetical protein [Dokdonella sp.]|uniref:hypothetical protein n=1 Tax=Dokdonella sp. TaxID=2291710 RepID=UPI0037832C66
MQRKHVLAALLGGVLALDVFAQTLDEDEARIEELMNAPATVRSVAPAPAASATVDDSINETPIAAAVVAPAQSADDEWLAPKQNENAMEFADLAHSIGARVSIVTTNEREHHGVVTSADAKQVTIEVRRKGGNASYVLKKEQILKIESR